MSAFNILPTTTDHSLIILSEDGFMRAFVSWDGCVDIQFGQNEGFHTCDLPDLIKRLQAVHAEAIKHFSEDWEGQ